MSANALSNHCSSLSILSSVGGNGSSVGRSGSMPWVSDDSIAQTSAYGKSSGTIFNLLHTSKEAYVWLTSSTNYKSVGTE